MLDFLPYCLSFSQEGVACVSIKFIYLCSIMRESKMKDIMLLAQKRGGNQLANINEKSHY